jgi:type IV secretion system protein VirB5
MPVAERSFYPPDGGNSTAFTQTSKELPLLDTIQGTAQRNARTWQVVALASMSSFFISLILLAYAVSLPKTVPVIVTVSPDGEARYAGKVDRSAYGSTSVPDIAREYQIKKLISRMHSRVIDPQAQRLYVAETQAVVQSGAIRQLDSFYRADNPYDRIGEETRSVLIEPLLKQTDNTFVCYFTVTRRHNNGYELSNDRWSMLVNTDVYEPSPDNPLGIYITNFDLKQITEEKK